MTDDIQYIVIDTERRLPEQLVDVECSRIVGPKLLVARCYISGVVIEEDVVQHRTHLRRDKLLDSNRHTGSLSAIGFDANRTPFGCEHRWWRWRRRWRRRWWRRRRHVRWRRVLDRDSQTKRVRAP